MEGGWQRTLVLAVGRPAGWVSQGTGLAALRDELVKPVKDDADLDAPGFGSGVAAGATPQAVTPDAFDPQVLGAPPARVPPLRRVLVTGDSLAQPLDRDVARAFARAGGDVRVTRDVHLGTGISQADLLDWGALSATQARDEDPDAVIVFLGANEGFPFGKVQCCGPDWAAAYATRARQMMSTYRRGGRTRVYWLNLPVPRSGARQRITRAVNAAVAVAAEPYVAQVRVLDMATLFTPGGRYRDAMAVGGRDTIVREQDGVHLNDAGASVALGAVLTALRRDFGAEAVPR